MIQRLPTKSKGFWLIALIISAVIFILPFFAQADLTSDLTTSGLPVKAFEFAEQALLQTIRNFLFIAKYTLNSAVGLAGKLLDYALNQGDFADSELVNEGSRIVREVANMFFILILIVASFGLILRIEPYAKEIKGILVRLIIAGLLINFSVVIAVPIIDFSQVFAHYFISGIQSTSFLAMGAHLPGITDLNQGLLSKIADVAWADFNDIFNLLGSTIILAIMFFVLIAGVFFMLARIVTLWVLLIFSPIIWACWILPATKKYWDQWWGNFLKWTLFAPVYTFMIYITVYAIRRDALLKEMVYEGKSAFQIESLENPNILFQFIVIAILLIYSLIIAQQFGIYGSQAVMKLGKNLYGAAKTGTSLWLAKGGRTPATGRVTGLLNKYGLTKTAKYTQRYSDLQRKVARSMSPEAWSRAWSQHQKRADAAAFPQAQGQIEDVLAIISSPVNYAKNRKSRTSFAELRRQQAIAAQKDEFNKALPQNDRLVNYIPANDIEKEAHFSLMAERNALKDYFKSLKDRKKIGDGVVLNATWIKNHLEQEVGQSKAASLGHLMAGQFVSEGNYQFAGMTKWDNKENRYVWNVNDYGEVVNAEIAAELMTKNEPQKLSTGLRKETFINYDSKGNLKEGEGSLSDVGKAFFKKTLTPAHIKQIGRLKTDTLQAIYKARDEIEKYSLVVGADQRKIIKEYLKDVEKHMAPKEQPNEQPDKRPKKNITA